MMDMIISIVEFDNSEFDYFDFEFNESIQSIINLII